MSRNGAEYCEAWAPAAERHGLLIVAITFSTEAWPDAVTYNNDHVLAEDGSLRPRQCKITAMPNPYHYHAPNAAAPTIKRSPP
jgi:hypothetical protein